MARQQRLVTTQEAAQRLGISARTLQRWAAEGLIKPDFMTLGGQYRWDVERLRRDIKAQAPRELADED